MSQLNVGNCSLLLCLVLGFSELFAEPTREKISEQAAADWVPPQGKKLSSSTSNHLVVQEFASPRALAEIWSFYASELGLEDKTFQTGLMASHGTGDYLFIIHNSIRGKYATDDDPGNRYTVQTANLVRRGKGLQVTVLMSRGKDEKYTYVNVILESR